MNRIALSLVAIASLAGIPGVQADPAAARPRELHANYELRGFFGSGDALEVSIRVGRTDSSMWLRVGERFGNLVVLSADPDRGLVVIETGGIRRTLRLEREAERDTRRRT